MSLPDHLLDDRERACVQCGCDLRPKEWDICIDCKRDLEDMYADEKISEGRRR